MNINEVARNTRPQRYQRHVKAMSSWGDKPFDYEFWLKLDEYLVSEGIYTNHEYIVLDMPCVKWLGLTSEEKGIAIENWLGEANSSHQPAQ